MKSYDVFCSSQVIHIAVGVLIGVRNPWLLRKTDSDHFRTPRFSPAKKSSVLGSKIPDGKKSHQIQNFSHVILQSLTSADDQSITRQKMDSFHSQEWIEAQTIKEYNLALIYFTSSLPFPTGRSGVVAKLVYRAKPYVLCRLLARASAW